MSFSREKFPKSSTFKFPVKFQNLLFKPKKLIGLKSFFLQKVCGNDGGKNWKSLFSYYWFCDPLGSEECSNREKGTAYFFAFFFHFLADKTALHIFTTFLLHCKAEIQIWIRSCTFASSNSTKSLAAAQSEAAETQRRSTAMRELRSALKWALGKTE